MPKLLNLLFTLFLISMGYVALQSVDTLAAGQYSFNPPNGTFYVGRRFETEIKINTDQATTAADIQVKYDACKLQVEDAYPGVVGVQIFPGTVFPSYPNIGNVVTTSGCNGLIKLTGFTADSSGVLQGGGNGVFGKIRFKVVDIDLAGSVADIVTTGFGPTFTLDSNISDTNGFDMLDGKTNGSFILREDINTVPDGDDRPFFDTFSPAGSGTGVSLGTNITFRANDNESGIDITSLSAQVTINGGSATTYNSSSSELTSNCTTSNLDAVPTCNITINPAANFPYDSQVCVSPTTRDLARKIGSLVDISHTSAPLTYCFRTEFDLNKPFTDSNQPGKNSTGVSTGSGFTFNLGDNETGVDISTLIVSIDGVDYAYTYTGSSNNYAITVNGLPALNQNQTYTVRIRAKDNATQNGVAAPNQLDETYTFKTADTNKPFVDTRSPAANGNLTNLCDPIVFHVKDTGSGVDINGLRVIISATGEYTKTGSQIFSYAGSNADYTITISPPVGCWPSNLPLAVGVFAKDADGNYLDADIWAIANGGTNIIYQTITETIVREVPVTVTDVQIREIIKTLPSNLTTKEIITILSDKIGFPMDENLLSKTDKNIEAKLQALVGQAQNVRVEKVNSQTSDDKKYWTWEYTGMEISGKGTAGETLWIELTDGNVGVQVTVDENGNWTAKLPATLNGLKDYQVTSRPIIDGKLAGNRTPVGKITVIPWWWIIPSVMGTLAILGWLRQNQEKRKLLAKVKELSNLPR
jgi:Cohesin domain